MNYNVYNSGHVPVGTGQQLPQQPYAVRQQGQMNANVVTYNPPTNPHGVPARQIPGQQANVQIIPPHIQPTNPYVSNVAIREVPGTGGAVRVVNAETHLKKDPRGV